GAAVPRRAGGSHRGRAGILSALSPYAAGGRGWSSTAHAGPGPNGTAVAHPGSAARTRRRPATVRLGRPGPVGPAGHPRGRLRSGLPAGRPRRLGGPGLAPRAARAHAAVSLPARPLRPAACQLRRAVLRPAGAGAAQRRRLPPLLSTVRPWGPSWPTWRPSRPRCTWL